jgi:hypothetical protein
LNFEIAETNIENVDDEECDEELEGTKCEGEPEKSKRQAAVHFRTFGEIVFDVCI